MLIDNGNLIEIDLKLHACTVQIQFEITSMVTVLEKDVGHLEPITWRKNNLTGCFMQALKSDWLLSFHLGWENVWFGAKMVQSGKSLYWESIRFQG